METKGEEQGAGAATDVVGQQQGRSGSSRHHRNSFVSQRNALRPPMPEAALGRPLLGAAVLRRVNLADRPGGLPETREVLTSVESGLTCMFVRRLKKAIYGEVWDALEIQQEAGGYFTIRRDAQGLERRLAVKRMPWDSIRRLKHKENPLHEMAALIRLRDPGHPNVLKLVEALDDGAIVYVLTPFIDGGEMFDWVAETGASPEDRIRPLFRQLVEGMRYIHSRGVSHADMSLENALIDCPRENAFIIDFGMSLAMPSDAEGRRVLSVPDERLAKPGYCAPEVWKQKAYDAVKADVFSAGAMLFMMLTGVPAFNVPSRTDAGFLTVVWRGDVQGFLRYYDLPLLSADAVDLLRKTMAYDPKNRLMPDELLRHRWFRRTPPAAVSAPAVAITGSAVGVPREEQSASESSPRAELPPQPPTVSGVTASVRDVTVAASETAPTGTGQPAPEAEQRPPQQKVAEKEDDNRTVLLPAARQQASPAAPDSEPPFPPQQPPGAKPAAIPPNGGEPVVACGMLEAREGGGTTGVEVGTVLDGKPSPDGCEDPTE